MNTEFFLEDNQGIRQLLLEENEKIKKALIKKFFPKQEIELNYRDDQTVNSISVVTGEVKPTIHAVLPINYIITTTHFT